MSGLELSAVSKAFDGTPVLSDVSLTVRPGRVCALVGPNGAGKSTLLHICLGFIRADAGRVTIMGSDVDEKAIEVKRRIAYVPDIARLQRSHSAIETLLYFDRLLGRRTSRADCHATLESLGFSAADAERPSGTYSKGMRQKVSIALGLRKGADVFLLDEPTAGLDAPSLADFTRILGELKKSGKTICFTSHDHAYVAEVADFVATLSGGRLQMEQR